MAEITHIQTFAVRTPTIPPATHTNCYRVGDVVIDPASPWPEEQAQLLEWLGEGVRRIVITHHHRDHVGGVAALARATGAMVYAHADARVDFPVDATLQDGDVLETDAGALRCWHTPGHADGHLVFQHDEGVIAGDLVAGIGTIVLAPPEGHLTTYLRSLARVRDLIADAPIFPAHGPMIPDGRGYLQMYIDHRHHRSAQILAALRAHGAATPTTLAERVYAGIPGVNLQLATIQIYAHLIWLVEQGEITPIEDRFTLA